MVSNSHVSGVFIARRCGSLVALAALSALLQACGGGSGDSTANAANAPPVGSSPPAVNHAPSIAGTPSPQARAGAAYTFTPQASDADGDHLTFSIANKPSWASFNASTGQLSGTPTAANVGSFANVVITVSDGSSTAALSAFSITVSATSVTTGSATLSWSPPTERTDGTALTNLAGYTIRYGTAPDTFTVTVSITTPGVASYVIDNLTSGTYYFVVTAVDAAGLESPFSSPVSKTII
jgi:hypothetical protein